jgi:hypothetical protein
MNPPSAQPVNHKTAICHVPGIGHCQGQLNPSANEDFVTTVWVRPAGEYPEFRATSPRTEHLPKHRKAGS